MRLNECVVLLSYQILTSVTNKLQAGNVAPDVGQFCGAFALEHTLPRCKSRVWKVTLTEPVPSAATAYDVVSLQGWDNAGLEVIDSQFFGGIDGIHSKSNGARFENNTFACTGFDVSPWQHYLEGPPHLSGMTVVNNTFTACGGKYGGYTVTRCTHPWPVSPNLVAMVYWLLW